MRTQYVSSKTISQYEQVFLFLPLVVSPTASGWDWGAGMLTRLLCCHPQYICKHTQ